MEVYHTVPNGMDMEKVISWHFMMEFNKTMSEKNILNISLLSRNFRKKIEYFLKREFWSSKKVQESDYSQIISKYNDLQAGNGVMFCSC